VPFPTSEGFAAPIKFLREGGPRERDGGSTLGRRRCPGRRSLAGWHSTSPVAAALALRTGARLVPVAIRTCGIARWRIVAGEPSHPDGRPGGADRGNKPAPGRADPRVARGLVLAARPLETPSPNFLLSKYKRGVCYPEGFDQAALKPFRILVRSSNWLGDAVLSVPAVRAIKAGRPDARVSILTAPSSRIFWREIPGVDEVTGSNRATRYSAWRKKITGGFDVAVLFPNSTRSALEAWARGYSPPHRLTRKRPPPFPDGGRGFQALKNGPEPPRHEVTTIWTSCGSSAATRRAFFLPALPVQAPEPGRPVKIGLCPERITARRNGGCRSASRKSRAPCLARACATGCSLARSGTPRWGRRSLPRSGGAARIFIGKTTLAGADERPETMARSC